MKLQDLNSPVNLENIDADFMVWEIVFYIYIYIFFFFEIHLLTGVIWGKFLHCLCIFTYEM